MIVLKIEKAKSEKCLEATKLVKWNKKSRKQ